MNSFDSSRMVAPTKVGLFHKIGCFFLVIRERPSSIILIEDMLPSEVVFKGSSSVLTKVTVTLFLKL